MSSKADGDSKLSFAKIAAMPVRQPEAHNTADELSENNVLLAQHNNDAMSSKNTDSVEQTGELALSLAVGIKNLDMKDEDSDAYTPESANDPKRSDNDSQTNLSDSSTKPTSFDTKSMASVTTFAMDEKESIRPDDSASVQAEDLESLSGAPPSQASSDRGLRAIREQYGTSAEYIRTSLQTSTAAHPQILSRCGDPNLDSRDAASLNETNQNTNIFPPNDAAAMQHSFPTQPDEKLIEAMNSSKDRLLVLQLEEKVIGFVKNSSEQSFELPPCNPFGRLLCHKLGDYYHLTHFVDSNLQSVRLHRTPWARLPTPLRELFATSATSTPPMTAPAMKIMRRAGPGGDRGVRGTSTYSSSNPSKATSENGTDMTGDDSGLASPEDGTPAKDRATLSREAREAKYAEARERIFKDFSESKPENSFNGDSNSMSRSSSTSGRKKNLRQRTPHDDSFEARSQFNAYYPNAKQPQNGGFFGQQGNGAVQTPYMVPAVSDPNMGYAMANQASGMYGQPGMPAYGMAGSPQQGNGFYGGYVPQQPGFQPYGAPAAGQMMTQQSSARSSPMNAYAMPSSSPPYPQPQPNWAQPYQQQHPNFQRSAAPVHWPSYPVQPQPTSSPMPYQYGQLPTQSFNQGMHGQPSHPIPGSFNRGTMFNPQTRSFIPGTSPPNRYSQKPMPGMNPNMGYNQPQGNYHTPDWSSPSMQPALPHMTPNMSKAGIAPNIHNIHNQPGNRAASGSNTNTANKNSIAKWGTPSHLPPKPPPSQVPFAPNPRPPITTSPNSGQGKDNTKTSSKAISSAPFVVGSAPQGSTPETETA